VLFGHGEDDGFAGQVPAAIPDADLHDLFPLATERITVGDEHFEVGTGVIEGVGIEALLDQGGAVLLAQVGPLDAFALKAGLGLVEPEIHQPLFRHGLLVGVEKGRGLFAAMERAEGVAVDEGRRGRRQADHPGVKILDHLGETVSGGAAERKTCDHRLRNADARSATFFARVSSLPHCSPV